MGVIKWCARRDLNPQPRPSRASFSNHSSTVSPPGWDSERLLADAEANRRESKSHGWSRFGFREEILGHRDIQTTLRYAYLAPGHLREAVNRGSLAKFFDPNHTRTGISGVKSPAQDGSHVS